MKEAHEQNYQLLKRLTESFGPTGFEKEVRNIFATAVAARTEITYDNLGSILALHQGQMATPRILVAAHLDEVGLMVRGILPNGYLKVVALGGWWPPALLAQRMILRSRQGDYLGVLGAKPPHSMSATESKQGVTISDLCLDVGATNETEVAALGIAIGDPLVPAVTTEFFNGSQKVVGKALDDRAGCTAVIRLLQELDQTHPNLVLGAGSVQEEYGTKGATTLGAVAKPDLAIVVEGVPADDGPDAGNLVQARLGGGPQLRFCDPRMLANRALLHLAEAEAQKQAIPYQLAVRESGGTDGAALQLGGAGVPVLVVSIPVRYVHSHQSILHLGDLEATISLLKALIYTLDETTVWQIKRNPWG